MNNTHNPIADATAPVTISLDPEAFSQELNALIPPNKVGWTINNHMALLDRLLVRLKDATGASVALPPAPVDILKLIIRPNQDLQHGVLSREFVNAGLTFDAETEQIFVLMYSAAQFEDFLAATENPITKQPFIRKEKKRGVKKSKFAALIAKPVGASALKPPTGQGAEVAPQEETPTEDDLPADEEEDQPTGMEPALTKQQKKASGAK